MKRTAIRDGWVVGWIDGKHQILDGGTVVIEGTNIIFVGFPNDPNCPPADHVIYAKGKLVSPGLINLHCIANLDLQILNIDQDRQAGYNRPASIMETGTPHILSDADFRISAEFSVAALLKAGNTSFGSVTTGVTKLWEDPVVEPYALAEASDTMGARAWLAHIYQEACDYMDANGTPQRVWDRQKAQDGLDNAISFIKYCEKNESKRITGFLFPYQTARCSDELLQETMHQSKLLNSAHVRTHFSQGVGEFQAHRSKRDGSMIDWLQEIGFLGPQVCLTHAIYIAGHSATGDPEGQDLDILAKTGTSVCHTPIVYARGGNKLESFSRYVKAGVNMGLGCDTFPPDLVEEMRFGSIINKLADSDREAGMARDFFNAATIVGAKALGREDIGRLEAGCKADISIFNLTGLSQGPIDDPMRTFIHFANRTDCETVIIDGKVVVDDGHVVGLDEEELVYRAQGAWERYKSGMANWNQLKKSANELYKPFLPIIKSS